MAKMKIFAKKAVKPKPHELGKDPSLYYKLFKGDTQREDLVMKEIICGSYPIMYMSDGKAIIDIGSVRYGQSTDILIKFENTKNPQDLDVKGIKVKYETQASKFCVRAEQNIRICNKEDIYPHILRFATVKLLSDLFNHNWYAKTIGTKETELKTFINNWISQNLPDEVS